VSTFILRRAGIGVLTLLFISVLVFALSRLIGNPADIYLDPSATIEDRAKLTAALGLDQPLYIQYLSFLERAVLHADLGRSYYNHRPVVETFFNRFWNTAQLGLASFGLSVVLAIPIGIASAVYRDSWWDWLARGFVFLGQALPHFWLGIMLILLFSVKLNLLPPAGNDGPASFILPAITLGWAAAAGVARLMRSSMLDILSGDYIRTARAKGLAEAAVVRRHALRNALIPTVAYSAVVLVRAFVIGSIVVETVFGWPGIGRLAYESTFARDFPMIEGIVVFVAIIVILANLTAEVLYALLDPRIRYS
jgi:peptide/nickel transport system permease protein